MLDELTRKMLASGGVRTKADDNADVIRYNPSTKRLNDGSQDLEPGMKVTLKRGSGWAQATVQPFDSDGWQYARFADGSRVRLQLGMAIRPAEDGAYPRTKERNRFKAMRIKSLQSRGAVDHQKVIADFQATFNQFKKVMGGD